MLLHMVMCVRLCQRGSVRKSARCGCVSVRESASVRVKVQVSASVQVCKCASASVCQCVSVQLLSV